MVTIELLCPTRVDYTIIPVISLVNRELETLAVPRRNKEQLSTASYKLDLKHRELK